MAGYICKIVIEDTHPPVWRRVVIPEKITFKELHEIMQILFDWQDMHLHAFEIPADHICIDDEGDSWGDHYDEAVTLIDSFFKNYKWVRYTYDFGDDWRHRINIEKIDETYQARYVTLLKVKGDNFAEDSGGIWGYEEDERNPFQKQEVEHALSKKKLKYHDELEEEPLLKEAVENLKDLISRMMSMEPEVQNGLISNALQEMSGDVSAMTKKIDAWRHFEDDDDTVEQMMEITQSEKSVYELMLDLGEKEASDYYKYLRLPQDAAFFREQKIAAIADELKTHPEYLCYIFDPEEYRNLEKLVSHPGQGISWQLGTSVTIIKMLGLGLSDFTLEKKTGTFYLASDIKEYIGILDTKTKKKMYRKLDQMSERIGQMLQVYGVMERDALYEMYKKLYDSKQEEREFERFIYWHLRFNDIVNTAYLLDGTCYVSSKELDAQRIVELRSIYSEKLDYRKYSVKEIADRAESLGNRSDWMDILFSMLCQQFKLNPYEAEDFLVEIVCDIFNGRTIDDIVKSMELRCKKYWDMGTAAEIWSMLTGLMLDLELPMLKGRTRQEYAEERKISPWTIGMISDEVSFKNTKDCHMYEFPPEVQEWMYDALGYDEECTYDDLLAYKKKNNICSEEYLYLLAEVGIDFDKNEKEIVALLSELKRSSQRGKKGARVLEEMWRLRTEVMDDNEDWYIGDAWDYMDAIGHASQPYVRTEPKIGRNDPCPCGSGKKYKKCCGKGK